jgi:sirohydrochlorin cobaltochelatase
MTLRERWHEEALLLIGHGAARFADAGRILRAHADALRNGGHFAEVAVGWLNDSPAAADALAGLTARVVHVVPFFMEHGWFVREAIPAALGAGDGHLLRYHPPVGVHPRMAEVAAARVVRACAADAARFSVLLVGHGSAHAPGRPMALHQHACALATEVRFARVRAAFLAEAPFVADALADWRQEAVAVVGFFAGEGGHAQDDLPRALATERALRGDAGAPVLDLGLIADDPAMPGIILAQAATGN